MYASMNRELANVHISGFMRKELFLKQDLKLTDEAPCETMASAAIPDTSGQQGSLLHQNVALIHSQNDSPVQ